MCTWFSALAPTTDDILELTDFATPRSTVALSRFKFLKAK